MNTPLLLLRAEKEASRVNICQDCREMFGYDDCYALLEERSKFWGNLVPSHHIGYEGRCLQPEYTQPEWKHTSLKDFHLNLAVCLLLDMLNLHIQNEDETANHLK